jgi:hypothetical protein
MYYDHIPINHFKYISVSLNLISQCKVFVTRKRLALFRFALQLHSLIFQKSFLRHRHPIANLFDKTNRRSEEVLGDHN